MEESVFCLRVTEAPFFAVGDGVTNDRPAIQSAIDAAAEAGGGTVILTGHKTYLSGGIILKSHVTLYFEAGAVLYQSPDNTHYVKPTADGYEPYTPDYGHNFSEVIKWSHYWYRNYPLIFAPAGSHHFAVKGKGTVRMMETPEPEKIMKICPIGFFRCSDFEISDIHITNYHSYAMMPFTSQNGLIKNVRIDNWSYGNGDGICLMNCRNIRVTGCKMFTGDDSVYIFSSCKDPRKSEWWDSDTPSPSENIEIDHNDLISNHCKAFGMILWGLNCDDLEKVEVRNIHVHDNHFETMGNWLYNPYTDKAGFPPVTSVRFENNVIDGIEANFFETHISDMNVYPSMPKWENGNFEQGRCFWAMKKNGDEDSVGVDRLPLKGEQPYGYIRHTDKGTARLYQGLFIKAGKQAFLRAEVKSAGNACRLFVRDLNTDELIAALTFDNTEYEEKYLYFTVPADGNYRLGLENTDNTPGYAQIKQTVFGYHENAAAYRDVIFDRGKVIFRYNDKLFKRQKGNDSMEQKLSQLKMYWLTDNDLPEMTLPEGYSFSHYKNTDDIHDWNECIRTRPPLTPEEEADNYKREIIDFKDITPEEDMWFLDYKGEHIGTATSFVHKATGTGDMHWVGIKEAYRGRGLSKYLSYIVQKTLKDRGVPYVSLTTGEGRPAAVKSYLNAGFLPVEYAEGMVSRWEALLEKYHIDSLQMLNEDATPFKVITK